MVLSGMTIPLHSGEVVERLKALIAERGESSVLYDLDGPVLPPQD